MRKHRGAFSLEYAALVVIVAAAMIGMAIYMKRALMGKWRAVGDTFGHGKQFEVP
jgi:Flp pilus assembly pilin Flp